MRMQKQWNLSTGSLRPHDRRNIIKVATPMLFPRIEEALHIQFTYLYPPHWIEHINRGFVCSNFTNYYCKILLLLNNITNYYHITYAYYFGNSPQLASHSKVLWHLPPIWVIDAERPFHSLSDCEYFFICLCWVSPDGWRSLLITDY